MQKLKAMKKNAKQVTALEIRPEVTWPVSKESCVLPKKPAWVIVNKMVDTDWLAHS